MSKKAKVSLEFKKEPVSLKIVIGESIHDKIAASPSVFTELEISLTAMDDANNTLSNAVTEARSGDHEKIKAQNEAEKAWNETFTLVANYVDRKANGVESIILLAGFKATVTNPVASVPTEAPANVTGVTSLTIPGGAHLQCNVIDHAITYMYFIATTASPVVLNQGTFIMSANTHVVAVFADTHNKVDLVGLPEHTTLYVTVMGVNRAGYGAANNPVSFRTL